MQAEQQTEKTDKDTKTDKKDAVSNEKQNENVVEKVHIEETETQDISEQETATYMHVDIRL